MIDKIIAERGLHYIVGFGQLEHILRLLGAASFIAFLGGFTGGEFNGVRSRSADYPSSITPRRSPDIGILVFLTYMQMRGRDLSQKREAVVMLINSSFPRSRCQPHGHPGAHLHSQRFAPREISMKQLRHLSIRPSIASTLE